MQKRISQEGLKGVACLTMLVDHAAAVFGGSIWLRVLGRLAFPIYCFLLTEGVRHTRDIRRYLLRMLVAAILTEPIYDMTLYPGRDIWLRQNVLWTLLLGCCMLWCMEQTPRPEWKPVWMFPFALAAQLCHTSYGGNGILMIALFGLTRGMPREHMVQTIGLLAVNWTMRSSSVLLFGLLVPIQRFAVLAMMPIVFYSGEKRTGSKAIAWGFYLFYPVQLWLLWLLKRSL